MSSRPLISIITPSYNSLGYISKVIDSVHSQTLDNYEWIIIDDCSTDKSWELLNKNAKNNTKIKLLRNKKNLGAAKSRNLGIENACGKYIAFLDSDDQWLPHKLEKQISFMEDKKIVFSFSDYFIKYKNIDGYIRRRTPPRVSYEDILKQNKIGCLTAIYNQDSLGKVYMPEIKRHEDFGSWLRILKKTPYAYGIQEPLAIYNVLGSSLSANKLKAAKSQWKIYSEHEKLGTLLSSYYFMHYFIRGILERISRFFSSKHKIEFSK